jgi:chitinase
MKHFSRFLRTLTLACLLASFAFAPATLAAPHSHRADGKQVVGYFIEWGIYGRNYLVKNIVTSGSADKLTVINYAFGNVAPDATGQVVCKLGDEWADYQKPWAADQSVTGQEVTWPNPILGNFQQLKALKGLYPHLRVVISLGGWTWSKYFSDAALTPASRAAFVQSCIDLFIKGNLPDPGWGGMGGPGSAAGVFDGIDVDWEYPASEGNAGNIVRPEDTQNFTALLAEFRSQLDAVRPGLLLTIASPAAQSKYSKIELDQITRYLDWINLLTYDFHGTWENTTNFHANLSTSPKDPSRPRYSVDDTVRGYLKAGVPSEQIVVGLPFYGRGWTGVTNANRGLYQSAAGPAPGTWEAGVEDYKVLKTLVGSNGFARYWDAKSQDAWLFNGATFWTFDDEQTIARKTLYVHARHLGGVMFWELSGDDADGTLIAAIANGLD